MNVTHAVPRMLTAAAILTALTASMFAMPSTASAGPERCPKVMVIAVRGSGENDDNSNGNVGRMLTSVTQPLDRLPGVEVRGLNYPARPVIGKNWDIIQRLFNTLGAKFRLPGLGAYNDSMADGRSALLTKFGEVTAACQSAAHKTRYVLVGYSQGAQILGDMWQKYLGDTFLSTRVLGMALFGDPKFNPTDRQSVAGTFHSNRYGLLGHRAYFSSGKVRSWCRWRDPVCQGVNANARVSDHGKYKDAEGPAAVRWLAGIINAQNAPPASQAEPDVGPGTGQVGSAPDPGTSDAPPAGSGPRAVSLGQGPAAPAGFRYAIGLTGFPANSVVSITCFDSVSPGGFYTFNLTVNAAGAASTASYCYSGDGPDHWVTAAGISSNHVSWGAGATQSNPPPPGATYGETTGGVTHTWTNYLNAGGVEGPTIGSNQTVQIACKITGFRVADGNTWWYRIAASPWNGAYYASADAFYNNGQTAGSLHGTPFVDPNVRDC